MYEGRADEFRRRAPGCCCDRTKWCECLSGGELQLPAAGREEEEATDGQQGHGAGGDATSGGTGDGQAALVAFATSCATLVTVGRSLVRDGRGLVLVALRGRDDLEALGSGKSAVLVSPGCAVTVWVSPVVGSKVTVMASGQSDGTSMPTVRVSHVVS